MIVTWFGITPQIHILDFNLKIMPEVMFKVKWPDGKIDDCYSPSTVISDYLKEGESYSVKDFVELSSQALNLASERVSDASYHISTSPRVVVEKEAG